MKSLVNQIDSDGVILATVDDLLNKARANSLFYMLFGLACCGIEMMQTGGPRGDLDRFGAIPILPTPAVWLLQLAMSPGT